MNQFIIAGQSIVIEMGDKVPTVCSSKHLKKEKNEQSRFSRILKKILNSFLFIFIVGVLVGSSCGVCVVYFYVPCSEIKVASDGDLIITSNITCLQSQTPAQGLDIFGMHNITFIDESSHLQKTILVQELLSFLQITELINKSLPPFSEGGVSMLRKELLQVIQQLKNDIQKASNKLKKLQESLKPKSRRRPSLH